MEENKLNESASDIDKNEVLRKLKRKTRICQILVLSQIIILVYLIVSFICSIIDNSHTSGGLVANEIDVYNSEFINYEGTISGTNVKFLIAIIKNHNSSYSDDLSKQIVVQYGNTSIEEVSDTATNTENLDKLKSTIIKAGKKYTIDFGYLSNGRIKVILINPENDL